MRVPASLFEHKHGYIEPNKDSSFKYPCDKSFSNKGDFKRDEITKHYGVQFKCTQCVCSIPEKTILCTTLEGFMRKTLMRSISAVNVKKLSPRSPIWIDM